MRLAIFIDGTFIPERDGSSTRFAYLPRHLSQIGVKVAVFHCYRGWSDLRRIALEPFPTYFFPPEIFYNDIECLVRILRDLGIDIIQMNDVETITRIGFPIVQALDIKVIYEAHYHTSTLASSLGASRERVEELQMLERGISQQVDHLVVFTEEDRRRWLSLSKCPEARISVVPFGINTVLTDEYPDGRQGLAFIGNGFFEPNRRAIQRIATEIAPTVRSIRSATSVTVIGDCPGEVRDLCVQSDIRVIGEVRDPLSWLAQGAIGLAPVSEGSGVRVKILQYASAGMPVVATPEAAEGLNLPSVFIENDSKSAALRCIDILDHGDRYEPLVRNTQSVLRNSFLWPHIAQTASGVYSRVMEEKGRSFTEALQHKSSRMPIWIEEVLRKGRFPDAETRDLGRYRFGLAESGRLTIHK